MNNVRRGERATFAGLFALSAGALCVALTACSSGSDSGPIGGWGGTAGSSGNGNGASGPTDPTGGNGGSGSGGGTTVGEDASMPAADAGRGAKDGGVVDAAPVEDAGSPLTTFTLINTNVNTIVGGDPLYGFNPIPEDAVIDLSVVGKALSILANTTPKVVASVYFNLDNGAFTRTDPSAIYSLCGDNDQSQYTNCIQYFTVGKHTLTVTPYEVLEGGVDAGPMPSSTLYFSITNGGATDAGGGG
jgi:hypothetical protein